MTPRSLCLLAAALLAALPAAATSTGTFTWSDLPGYRGKSTNELIRQQAFKDFLRRELPAKKIRTNGPKSRGGGLQPLSDYAIEVLHGPPDPITLQKGRYYVLRACRAHSCDEKGLLVLDAAKKRITFAGTWYFSENIYARVPDILVAANGDVKTDPAAADRLSEMSPFIGRWIDDNKLRPRGFVILTDDGDSVFRSINAVDSSANVPHPAD